MTAELYTKGARVWVPHATRVWESAEVTQDFRGGSLIVRTEEEGQIRQVKIGADSDLPPLRNPSILVGQNDLTMLSYLHEPAVLHNLRVRFCDRNAIYTYCGIVLVAINPYSELPIYGKAIIMVYRGRAMGDLDPHIFAVSEEAYTRLERENRDQSIIVSGESGAGKTVSAKYAMRYFATVGGSSSETQVEKKVLASSPIMEAMGNAKTTRNDNSSRFGKFIQINFNRAYRIVGASMRTYLLEKSRVVFQAPDERNYHIFYQLCSARDQFPELALGAQDTFMYLNQGGNPYIDGVDDEKTFQDTRLAMTTLGFSDTEQMEMFKVLAAILHLGNIDIYDSNSEDFAEDEQFEDGGFISSKDPHAAHFTAILGIPMSQLRLWLTHRRITSATETIETRMDGEKARAARDALAKRMYAELFNWCVRGVNRALNTNATVLHFIGVLDIYGFETFEVNSFEQFCINYANEKLQQQFNLHVFKLEQEEYLKEKIEWNMISFYDNQPCIDLIESKMGILALLDEECRIPKGSDRGWNAKLRDKCSHYKHFAIPRFGEDTFKIKHFADDVEYQCSGFLDKNRDTVFEEQLEMIRLSSSCRLAADMCSGGSPADAKAAKVAQGRATLPVPQRKKIGTEVTSKPHHTQPAANKAHRTTVGAQFRASLADLMATLSATTPHYVRCIKPNDDKSPFCYDSARAVQQLRACGVLETIRISAAGFPSRWLYDDFFRRYHLLCNSSQLDMNDITVTCRRILERHIKEPDRYQFGHTKIFFRAGQVAYLEKIRGERRHRYGTLVQSQIRGFLARRLFKKIMKAVIGMQKYGRGFLARIKAREIRHNRAATVIQKRVRGWMARRKYLRIRTTVCGLQKYARGYLARWKYYNMRRHAAAVVIQKYVRGYLAMKHYTETRRRIVICQAAARRLMARRVYKQLRTEARSIEHVKKLNRGLENKIISLQQRINEINADNKQIKSLQKTIDDMKAKMEKLRLLEPTIKELRASVLDKDALIARLQSELTEERDNSVQLADERAKLAENYKLEKEKWEGEKNGYVDELKGLHQKYQALVSDNEVRDQNTAEKVTLAAELEEEKTAYQKLLAKYNDLQGRVDGENRVRAQQHKRSLSDVSSVSPADGPNDEDYEYGSGDPNMTSQPSIEAINWTMTQTTGPNSGDRLTVQAKDSSAALAAALVRLQRRLSVAEAQKALEEKMVVKLQERLAAKFAAAKADADSEDRFKLEELEIENKKLQDDLDRLRKCGKGEDNFDKELIDQFANLQEELLRRRDECIQLRSVLAKQRPWFQALKSVTVNLKSLASSNYGASDVDILNEDGELAQAFETQKKVNRQLEEELKAEKKYYAEILADLKADLERVNNEFEKLQKLHAGSTGPDAGTAEEYLRFELARIVNDNNRIQERNSKLSESCRKYKNQIRILLDKLKEAGIDDPTEILDTMDYLSSLTNGETVSAKATKEVGPAVRKKEREYLGMFEFRQEDDKVIVQRLILDLKPQTAIQLLPGLPAYILMMCIRHTDHVNDEAKVQSLLTNAVNGMKKLVRKCKDSNMEYIVLWLSNTVRLLHNLRQYSGDAIYQSRNTARQNQQALQLFDMSDFRQVFSDTAIFIYQALITMLEHQLERLIVPAILEHDEISGVGPGGRRPSQSSPQMPSPKVASPRLPEMLRAELTVIKNTLHYHGVDSDLIMRIFKQLYYFICSYSLNQLVLRKDLCYWAKGMQIRYNLSHLEVWAKETFLQPQHLEEVIGTLKPITQAVHLLQARKTLADVQSTVDMCPDLSTTQICKILNLYTPAEDFPLSTAKEFIRQIQLKIAEKSKTRQEGEQQTLLMDSKYKFPVHFPFNPSDIRLEDVELPDVLNLSEVLTKV